MTQAPPPLVSFIVVNFNGGPLLASCLASIRAQTLRDFEMIVFDNGSLDGSHQAAESQVPPITLLRSDRNLGFAEANNRAFEASQGRYVVLVNNDAWLDPRWAEIAVAALEADPEAGAAAGRTLQAAQPDRIDSAGFALFSCLSCYSWRGEPADALPVARHRPFGPVASVAMYRRAALLEAGLFHPEYFCYYEDTDLAARLVLHGYRTRYVDAAVAYHLGSQTGKEGSDFHLFHLRRNAELVYWVDMVGHLAWVNLPWHLAFEMLALGHATLQGRAGVVLRAKLDVLRRLRWIIDERKSLAAALTARGRLRSGQWDLWSSMRLGLPLVRLCQAWPRRLWSRNPRG